MEFIDNSIDAAEEFYDNQTNSYNKSININIDFSGSSLENFYIEIRDNCKGIDNLQRVVSSIGNSCKKDIPQLNGQFGLGMWIFVTLCNKMTITSSTNETEINRAAINANIFEMDNLDDTEVGISSEQTQLRMNFGIRVSRIGTTIRLENFDKDKYKQFDIKEFIIEVEKHFEVLLCRKNLKVRIKFPNGNIHECKAFDYEKYSGEIYYNKLINLEFTSVKKTGEKTLLNINDRPVIIYLKIIKNKTIERRPFFVIKGRRITEVSDVKAFRTNSKSMIWSHPNVIGYIDVSGCLEPTIARNEFKATKIQRALFNTLLKEEDKIKSFIDESLKVNLSGKYKKLESILENMLNEVARDLSKSKRQNKESEQNSKYLREGEKDNYQSFKIENRININNNKEQTDNEREKNAYNNRPPAKRYTQIMLPSINLNKTDRIAGNNLGFNVRINCTDEPLIDERSQKVRSILNGNEVIVYQKHTEFENRLDYSRDGIPRVTERLLNYLCCEILFHYKTLDFIRSNRHEEPKIIFLDFIEAFYSFQKKLNSLEGKKLSDFN